MLGNANTGLTLLGSHDLAVFVVHGFVGGLVSAVGGSSYYSGFIAAGVASLGPAPTGSQTVEETAEGTAESAILGGLGSVLGGGKFQNGAITGTFAYLFSASYGSGSGTGAANDNNQFSGLLDIAGKIWNLPNTVIGLAYGGTGYVAGWANFELGGQETPPMIDSLPGSNAIQFMHNPFAGLGAITIGNVEVFGGSPADIGADYNPMGVHEPQHTYQGQLLGPLYLPSNLLGGIAGEIFGGSWHAPQNWNEVGPQQHPPVPWPQ